ncbi:hypothetical protein ON010_g8351 [Phytophthora cinnamomi]|nr:hypothetical protein ON010_g8351 [Phytophthora cinnamomi]
MALADTSGSFCRRTWAASHSRPVVRGARVTPDASLGLATRSWAQDGCHDCIELSLRKRFGVQKRGVWTAVEPTRSCLEDGERGVDAARAAAGRDAGVAERAGRRQRALRAGLGGAATAEVQRRARLTWALYDLIPLTSDWCKLQRGAARGQADLHPGGARARQRRELTLAAARAELGADPARARHPAAAAAPWPPQRRPLRRQRALRADGQHIHGVPSGGLAEQVRGIGDVDCLDSTARTIPTDSAGLWLWCGATVCRLLKEFGAFEEDLVRVYVRDVVRGVAHLHELDIAHRDLKCANLLLADDEHGGVKIADFGTAKRASTEDLGAAIAEDNDDQPLETARSVREGLGSPFWMAPELVRAEKGADSWRKADIWGVGCVAIEMATGRPPWYLTRYLQENLSNPLTAMFHIASAATIPEFPAQLSSTAHDFLSLCFDKNPDTRASASELLRHPFLRDEVDEYQPVVGTSACSTARYTRQSEQSRREELLESYLVHWEQSVLDKWGHELWFRVLGRWVARARRSLARRQRLAQEAASHGTDVYPDTTEVVRTPERAFIKAEELRFDDDVTWADLWADLTAVCLAIAPTPQRFNVAFLIHLLGIRTGLHVDAEPGANGTEWNRTVHIKHAGEEQLAFLYGGEPALAVGMPLAQYVGVAQIHGPSGSRFRCPNRDNSERINGITNASCAACSILVERTGATAGIEMTNMMNEVGG